MNAPAKVLVNYIGYKYHFCKMLGSIPAPHVPLTLECILAVNVNGNPLFSPLIHTLYTIHLYFPIFM